MRRRTRTLAAPGVLFAAGVCILSLVVVALIVAGAGSVDPLTALLWTCVFLAGEGLWLCSSNRRGMVSMVMSLHLAAVILQGPAVLLPAVWLSRLVAHVIIEPQGVYRAFFNGARVSLAVAAASFSYQFLGGLRPGVLDATTLGVIAPAMGGAAVFYGAINTCLACGVIALDTRSSFWTAWRENYGYRVEIVALLLLVPVVLVAVQTLGPWGLIAFFLPMLLIRCGRYSLLGRTQPAVSGSERVAAKREMAERVSHELNNSLALLMGDLQMFQVVGGERSDRETQRLATIMEPVASMTRLSRGLMDLSRLETRPLPTDVCQLVSETVDVLRPQNRFGGIELDIECDPRGGVAMVDRAQIQQVLMHLLNNAAECLQREGLGRKSISVWARRLACQEVIEIGVLDNGPGVPAEIHGRIFAPGFSTRPDGHGFGLSTAHRIVANHRGQLTVGNGPEGGALFRVHLPADSRGRPLPAA